MASRGPGRSTAARCAMQDTSACDDCVVTFICSRGADDAVVVDVDEWKAVRLLQDAGLVPKLRHRVARPADRARRRPIVAGSRPYHRDVQPGAPLRRLGRLRRRPAVRRRRRRPAPGGGRLRRTVRRHARRPARPSRARAARRHAVHLPQPGPLHRPVPDARRRPQPRGRRPGPTRRRRARAPRRRPTDRTVRSPHGPGRVLRRRRPLRRAPRRPRRHRRPADRATATGPGCCSTTTPSSTAPPRTGPASAGSARTPTSCSTASAAGSCSARCSPTPPLAPDRRSGGRRLRLVHALPRRLPHRRHRRARRGRRPPVPGLAGAGPGRVPGRAPGGARRSPLRLRRLPGGLPAQPPAGARRVARPAPSRSSRHRRRRGSTCSTCSTLDDDALLGRLGRWYIADRDPDLCAATRSSCWATSRRSPSPATSWRRSTATCATPTPLLRGHAVWAARRLGCDDLAGRGRRRPGPAGAPRAGTGGRDSGRLVTIAGARRRSRPSMTHLLVTNDFPPKVGGIQSYLWELWRRLPPDEVTVLTTAHPDAAAFDADAAVPGRSASPIRSSSRRRRSSDRIDELADEVGADLVLLDPACRSGSAARSSTGPTASCCTAPRSPSPGACPFVQLLAAAHAPRRPARRRRRRLPGRGGQPGGRAHAAHRGRPARRRHHPLRAARRRRRRAAARARFGLDPAAHGRPRAQPPGAPQGLRRADPGGAPHARARPRRCSSSSPATAATGPASSSSPRRCRRPVRFLGRVDRRRPARRSTAAPTSSPCCAATAGSGSSRRASASSSSRPPPPASPPSPGAAAAPPRRSSTARPASSSTSPDRSTTWPRRSLDLLDDPGRRARLGAAARARAERSFSYDLLAAELQAALERTVAEIRVAAPPRRRRPTRPPGPDPRAGRRGEPRPVDDDAGGVTARRRRAATARAARLPGPAALTTTSRLACARRSSDRPTSTRARRLIVASWIGTGAFAAVSIPAAHRPRHVRPVPDRRVARCCSSSAPWSSPSPTSPPSAAAARC